MSLPGMVTIDLTQGGTRDPVVLDSILLFSENLLEVTVRTDGKFIVSLMHIYILLLYYLVKV